MKPTGYCNTCEHKEKAAFIHPCHTCTVLFQGMDQSGKTDNYQKESYPTDRDVQHGCSGIGYEPSMAAKIAATCPKCLNLECHCICERFAFEDEREHLSSIECDSDNEWLESYPIIQTHFSFFGREREEIQHG
jgi:hypothetical protein